MAHCRLDDTFVMTTRGGCAPGDPGSNRFRLCFMARGSRLSKRSYLQQTVDATGTLVTRRGLGAVETLGLPTPGVDAVGGPSARGCGGLLRVRDQQIALGKGRCFLQGPPRRIVSSDPVCSAQHR